MKNLILSISLVLSFNAFSECVHEKIVFGHELKQMQNASIFVETSQAIFTPVNNVKILDEKSYRIQVSHSFELNKNKSNDYNSKFLKYYSYGRIQKYLNDKKLEILNAGYEVKVIGKSIKGRDLYSVTPKVFKNKKTILMFGRHHGDEGTANWIIEGFFNEYLTNKKFRDEYQLVLYPMINPDGTEAKSRYNANGRDLNRSWSADPKNDLDEIKFIHSDLRQVMSKIGKNIFIALDMHGSFRKDFIYRVKENYVSSDFFNSQQIFINELAIFDSWQNGASIHSNGDPAMARLVLINHYKKNAMTHETVKNIPKRNNQGRSVQTLMDQGLAIVKSIQNLY